jgi:hypothetical protein
MATVVVRGEYDLFQNGRLGDRFSVLHQAFEVNSKGLKSRQKWWKRKPRYSLGGKLITTSFWSRAA